jgi:RHS repeat-associated protein
MPGMGLMDYRARFYSPYITHFNQSDSIVPDPYNPQAYNRYAYALNNPVNNTDPSGHTTCMDDFYWGGQCHDESAYLDKSLEDWGIKTEGLSANRKWDVLNAALLIANKLATTIGNNIDPVDAFRRVMGDISIIGGAQRDGCITNDHTITCGTTYDYFVQSVIHEFGHVFDKQFKAVAGTGHLASDYTQIGWDLTFDGYMCNTYPCVQHPDNDAPDGGRGRDEDFADMFLNWVLDANPGYPSNGFTTDAMGNDRRDYMNKSSNNPAYPTGMPFWLMLMGLR